MGRAVMLLVATTLAVAPTAARAEGPARPARSITVTGVGTATARPDTAYLVAGVVTRDASAARALEANSATMERVVAALRSLGVRAEDIRTVGLVVTPQHRDQKGPTPEITGYEVQDRVGVTVRDVGAVGRVLDRIVAEGANAVGGVAFSVADPAHAMDEARARAVADARRAAEALARAAGVKLGAPLEVSETPVPVPRVMASALAAAPPIEPGQQQIHVSVTVTFAIQ